MTYQSSIPHHINCTEIPRFLAQYEEQIKPDCKHVNYVFELFRTSGHYVKDTDLEHLVNFITWCNSSMLFEYTNTINNSVRNLFANGVTHLNHKPIFQDHLLLFTNKGVNLKKFRKCATKISKFRSEVYIYLLEFDKNEQVRYKKNYLMRRNVVIMTK